MIECEVCFEDYLEGNLEQHQGMCVLRLVFRCSICNEDYVSREGLWNHLDLHEIPDDSKELRYRELKANYKLHQCVLCNNQRAYSKSSYEIHISKFHDNYEARNRTKTSDFNSLLQAPESVKSEHMTSADEQLTQSREVPTNEANNRKGEESPVDRNVNEDNNSSNNPKVSNKSKSRSFACDDCGKVYEHNYLVLRHKRRNTCHVQLKTPCLICGKVLFKRKEENEAHFEKCKEKMWLCNLCGHTFLFLKAATTHNKLYHPKNGSLETLQLIPKEGLRREITSEKPTVSTPNSRVQALDGDANSRSNEAPVNEINANACKDNQDGLSGRSERKVASKKAPLSLYCKLCDITFHTHRQITYHRVVNHTEAKFPCSHCSQKFHYKERVKEHEACCQNIKLSCEICGKKFNTLTRLKCHIKNNHSNVTNEGGDSTGGQKISKQMDTTQGMNTCIICSKLFDSADELMKHTLTCSEPVKHTDDSRLATIQSTPEDDIKLEITVEEVKLQDEQCQISSEGPGGEFETSSPSHGSTSTQVNSGASTGLVNGIKVQEELPEIEKETGTDKNFAKTSESQTKQGSKCSICGQSFSNARKLLYHKVVHHSDPKYKCPFCQNMFHKASQLNYHQIGCSELRCHKCNIKFRSRGQLERHNAKKNIHDNYDANDPKLPTVSKNQTFECNVCDRVFTHYSSYLRHKNRNFCHVKYKYPCLTCGKSFNCKKDNLVHYQECKQKMWLCKLCARTFMCLQSITRHNKLCHPKNGSAETLQLIQREDLGRESTLDERTVSAPHSPVQALNGDASSVDVINATTNKDSRTALNGRRKRSSKKTPLSLSCRLCNLTFHSYGQLTHHRVVKHTDAKFQCCHCSRKFHYKDRVKAHEACCENIKLSCELCGKKLNDSSALKRHMENIHLHVNTKGGDGTEERNIFKQMDTSQEMTTCINCRKIFDSADELMKHKVTCLKPFEEPSDFRICTDDIKLEITVEEVKLQEDEYQISNEDPRRSVATSLHSDGSKEMHTRAEAVAGIGNEIEVQRVLLENDEGSSAKHQNAAKSSECKIEQGVICLICGQSCSTSQTMRYHKTVSHTDPRYKCSVCHKRFHFSVHLRNHEKGCIGMRCHKCDITFTRRKQLDKHRIEKHPNDDEDSSGTRTEAEISDKHKPPSKETPVRNELGALVWPCSICELTFETRNIRRYHRIVSHTEPQHKCIFCQTMFHVEADLRRHVNGCSATRCHECGIKFTSRALLKEHNINRHNVKSKNVEATNDETLEKEPRVEDKKPASKSLESQIESPVHQTAGHKVYPCPICGRTYNKKQSMVYHKVASHAEPTLKCTYCSKMFHLPQSLRSHMKICEELRCHECGIMFTRRAQLKNHNTHKHSNDDKPMKGEA